MKRRVAIACSVAIALLACGGAALAGDGVVALQSADPSCPAFGSSGEVYHPCGNGTVTHIRTGLVWLANADCFGQMTWQEAMDTVAGLADLSAAACGGMSPDNCDCGLSDHSSPGEWRLATMGEWITMIETAADQDCEPSILNDFGTNCWVEGCYELDLCSFYGVKSGHYWTSTPSVREPGHVWYVNLDNGIWGDFIKENPNRLWPVRDGQ